MEKWSNLPSHLLQLIIEKGGGTDELELRRLQAVCSLWRSSIINLIPRNSQLNLHHLPLLFSPSNHHPLHHASIRLSYDTIYLLRPPQTTTIDPSSCWLVRVKEENPGRVSLLCPVTQHRISYFPNTLPPQLYLLRFRVYQVTKIFHLRIMNSLGYQDDLLQHDYNDSNVLDLWKVVVLLSNHLVIILAINRKYDLCFLNLGDSKWRIIHHKDNEIRYIDIAVRDEKFYAIDVEGTVSIFDKSLNQIQTITTPSPSCGWGRHLVTSLDDMFLICRHNIGAFTAVVDYDKRRKCYLTCYGTSLKIEVDVYRLVEEDEELRWEKVRDLGDRVMFVSNVSCYSFSVKDFNGVYKRNCIYFGREWSSNIFLRYENRLSGLDHKEIVVFNMKDGSGGPLEAFPGFEDLFWPPPTWLNEMNYSVQQLCEEKDACST